MNKRVSVAFGRDKWIRLAVSLTAAAVLFLGLTACGSEGNTIAPWKAPDDVSQWAVTLSSGGGYTSFAEFTTDDSIRSVSMSIDCYRKGKLVKTEDEGVFTLEPEEEKNRVHGIVGFALRDGKLTMGQIADGLASYVSDAALPGYSAKSEEGLGFAPMSQETEIRPGEKICLGFIGTGDIANPEEALKSPELLASNEQAWVICAVFSDKPEDGEE